MWIGLGCLGLVFLLMCVVLAGLAAFTIDRSTTSSSPEAVIVERVEQVEPSEGELGTPENLNAIYEAVDPGVVSITAHIAQGDLPGGSSGSGFVLDEEGHIISNNHVVAGADTLFVTFFDGLTVPAEVIGTDPNSDLAVLKVEELVEGARPLQLGDSDTVRVGDRVVAIGNPFQLQNTMTFGIVSAVGRAIPSGATQYNIPQVIQTDAAINPGNSGGPLLDMSGRVIGVNAQIRTSSNVLGPGGVPGNIGIGFAIPVNIVQRVAPALIETGTYEWPYLGVSGFSVSPSVVDANDLPSQRGAYIDTITEGGPADEAGLQGSTGTEDVNELAIPVGGDVIIEADSRPINNFDDLLTFVALAEPGQEVTLVILRGGETIERTVTLGVRPVE